MNTGQKLNQNKSFVSNPAVKEIIFSVRVYPMWFDANLSPGSPSLFSPPYSNVDFPYFLFCEFDKKSGYSAGQKLLKQPSINVLTGQNALLSPLINVPYRYDGTFVSGSLAVALFSVAPGWPALVDIPIGSRVFSYTSWGFPVAPDPGCVFFVVESQGASYESICANTSIKDYYIDSIDMFCANPLQNVQAFHIVTMDEKGDIKTNPVSPILFKTQDYQQNVFIRMPMKIKLNQYIGFYSLFLFATTDITFVFKCKLLN